MTTNSWSFLMVLAPPHAATGWVRWPTGGAVQGTAFSGGGARVSGREGLDHRVGHMGHSGEGHPPHEAPCLSTILSIWTQEIRYLIFICKIPGRVPSACG